MLIPVFTFKRSFALLSAVFVLFAVSSFAAERDAQSVINELRLKQLTKNLSLTQEQQKQVKVLYDAEAKLMAKINDDENLTLGDRTAKKQALIKETNEKIKPVLTVEQKTKFEEQLAKATARKKPAAAKDAPTTPAAP